MRGALRRREAEGSRIGQRKELSRDVLYRETSFSLTHNSLEPLL